jgi:hypothetical protein
MSEKCQTRALADVRGKSALPSIADIPNPTFREQAAALHSALIVESTRSAFALKAEVDAAAGTSEKCH